MMLTPNRSTSARVRRRITLSGTAADLETNLCATSAWGPPVTSPEQNADSGRVALSVAMAEQGRNWAPNTHGLTALAHLCLSDG